MIATFDLECVGRWVHSGREAPHPRGGEKKKSEFVNVAKPTSGPSCGACGQGQPVCAWLLPPVPAGPQPGVDLWRVSGGGGGGQAQAEVGWAWVMVWPMSAKSAFKCRWLKNAVVCCLLRKKTPPNAQIYCLVCCGSWCWISHILLHRLSS